MTWQSENGDQTNIMPLVRRVRTYISRQSTQDEEQELGPGSSRPRLTTNSCPDLSKVEKSARPFDQQTVPFEAVPSLKEGSSGHARDVPERSCEHGRKERTRSRFMILLGQRDSRNALSRRNVDEDDETSTRVPNKRRPVWSQIRTVLSGWSRLLLVFIPAGFAVQYTHCNPATIFSINFVAIFPCVDILGFALDELSKYTDDNIQGLLSMTFSNAVQLITSVLLLKSHQIRLLKISLLGSILQNLLLMTGLAFFIGGLRRQEQTYNRTVAQTVSTLLLLATLSLLVPTASNLLADVPTKDIVAQSRGMAIVVMISYLLYLFFQLKTHRKFYEVEDFSSEEVEVLESEEPPTGLSIAGALTTMTVSTTLLSFNTLFATDSIQGLLLEAGLTETFVGLVLLPLLSSDRAAIVTAYRNKMDASIGLTLERCMQTSLMVVPLTVLLAWCMGIDEMTLQFEGFLVVALFAANVIVTYVVQAGTSNWLTGVLLIEVFVLISIAAYYIP